MRQFVRQDPTQLPVGVRLAKRPGHDNSRPEQPAAQRYAQAIRNQETRALSLRHRLETRVLRQVFRSRGDNAPDFAENALESFGEEFVHGGSGPGRPEGFNDARALGK